MMKLEPCSMGEDPHTFEERRGWAWQSPEATVVVVPVGWGYRGTIYMEEGARRWISVDGWDLDQVAWKLEKELVKKFPRLEGVLRPPSALERVGGEDLFS